MAYYGNDNFTGSCIKSGREKEEFQNGHIIQRYLNDGPFDGNADDYGNDDEEYANCTGSLGKV